MTGSAPHSKSDARMLEARFDGPIPGIWQPVRTDNPTLTRSLQRRRISELRRRMIADRGQNSGPSRQRELLSELWEILALPDTSND